MTDLLPGHAGRVYRVDRFTVPEGARAEFLSRVRQTHEALRAQPGFLQDLVLEEPGGAGRLPVPHAGRVGGCHRPRAG